MCSERPCCARELKPGSLGLCHHRQETETGLICLNNIKNHGVKLSLLQGLKEQAVKKELKQEDEILINTSPIWKQPPVHTAYPTAEEEGVIVAFNFFISRALNQF